MSENLSNWTQQIYVGDPHQQLSAMERMTLYPEHVQYPQECAMVHINTLLYRQEPRAAFKLGAGKSYPAEIYQRIGLPEPTLWLSKDSKVTYIAKMSDQHLSACLRMASNGKLDAFANPRNVKQMFDLAGAGPIMFSTYTQEVLESGDTPTNNINRKLRSKQYLTRIEGVVDLMRMYQQTVIALRNYDAWHILDERYYNMRAEALNRGLLDFREQRFNDETFEGPSPYKQLSLFFGEVLKTMDDDASVTLA